MSLSIPPLFGMQMLMQRKGTRYITITVIEASFSSTEKTLCSGLKSE
jgi:hypothetical protein